ncbi:uncharacterized protein BO87DRAFT_436873, partial [Aspergillus neoniger CBS 115656]
SGESPLLWALRACTSRLREIVIRSYGAVITNGTGDTNAVVSLLLRYGANPNIRSHHGRVPLFWAIKSGSVALVETPLKAGCDPIAKNRYRCTPLMSATVRGKGQGDSSIIQIAGIHQDALDDCGRSAVTEGRKVNNFHDILGILSQCSDKIASLPESILRLDGYQREVACDMCQVYIAGDGVYYRCSRCNDYQFAICDDCKTRGMVCLNGSHEMRQLEQKQLDAERRIRFDDMYGPFRRWNRPR